MEPVDDDTDAEEPTQVASTTGFQISEYQRKATQVDATHFTLLHKTDSSQNINFEMIVDTDG